jgi:hypothetical protein
MTLERLKRREMCVASKVLHLSTCDLIALIAGICKTVK